jgi:hypothetical protein
MYGDEHADTFATPRTIHKELEVFESQWQAVLRQHVFTTTRAIALIMGVGFGGTFLSMHAIELVWFYQGPNYLLIVGSAIAITLGWWLYRRARRCEDVRAEWQMKRFNLHERLGLPPSVVEGIPSLGMTFLKAIPGILGVAVLLVVILFAFCGHGMYWVGSRDLEITFVVTDAETGGPVPRALIEVPPMKAHFCNDCDGPIRLVADKDGVAKLPCKGCMCHGYRGWEPFFRWADTFSTHTPHWFFAVSGPGYHKREKIHLGEQAFRKTIERGSDAATMRVSISLHRMQN